MRARRSIIACSTRSRDFQSPTLERISIWLWDRLHNRLPGLAEIEVARDSCHEGCVYRGPGARCSRRSKRPWRARSRGAKQLGKPTPAPRIAGRRPMLERVANPHADTLYVARFTCAGIHLSLPGHRPARLRASRHRLRAARLAGGIEVAEALSRPASAISAPSTRTRPSPSASAWSSWSSPLGSGSAAIGIRAAASRSMCSGSTAAPPDGAVAAGARASRPIAAAAEPIPACRRCDDG